MKLNLRIIAIIITCGCSSCICPHEARTTIIDYDRLLFSNGEYTTLLSKYVIHDTLSTDSVDIGYSVLNGMCFAREPLYELYGQVNRERIGFLDCLFDWPHLIIPSLNLDIEITNVNDDSRLIEKGGLFFAIKGLTNDGNKFIPKAIENGAVCVVTGEDIEASVPVIKVDDVQAAYNETLNKFYDNVRDKLKFISVTGTDGKTTVSEIIYQLLISLLKKFN